jgi:hypothetical protein
MKILPLRQKIFVAGRIIAEFSAQSKLKNEKYAVSSQKDYA